MIFDTTLLERNKRYQYKKQILLYSHASINARGGKNFIFRTARGAWKRLSRNQLDHVYAVEQRREGFFE
jgi:hypothetical protein